MASFEEKAICPVCGSVVGSGLSICPVCGAAVELGMRTGRKSPYANCAHSGSGVPTTASLDSSMDVQPSNAEANGSATAKMKLVGVFALVCVVVMAAILVVVVLVGWGSVDDTQGDAAVSDASASADGGSGDDASGAYASSSSSSEVAASGSSSFSSVAAAQVVTEPAMDRDSGLGNSSGILADGGISVQVEGGCFMVCGDSIIYQSFDQVGTQGYTLVYKGDPAAYLNYADGYLYFISDMNEIDVYLAGGKIMRQFVSLGSLESQGEIEVIYDSSWLDDSLRSCLSDLACYNGDICFMRGCKTGSCFHWYDLDECSDILTTEFPDGATILQIDSGKASILERGCSTPDLHKCWGVSEFKLSRDSFSPYVVSLELDYIACGAMAVDGGVLVSGDEEAGSSLCKYSLTGGFEEYSGVKNAVHVACTGDSIVALSDSGELTCTSSLTGVTRNIGSQLTVEHRILSPESCHLGIYGDWVFVSDGSVLTQVNSKTGDVNVLCVG